MGATGSGGVLLRESEEEEEEEVSSAAGSGSWEGVEEGEETEVERSHAKDEDDDAATIGGVSRFSSLSPDVELTHYDFAVGNDESYRIIFWSFSRLYSSLHRDHCYRCYDLRRVDEGFEFVTLFFVVRSFFAFRC